MGIILALGIIFGILLLGVFLLICCKCCCCKPNSALMKACPCLATLAKAFSAHCMCDCCKGGADKSENEVTLGKNSKVVDNPIYEPKDKQEPAATVIPTPTDPTGPGEINDTPLSGDMGSGDMSLTKMGPDTDLQGGVITPPIPTESIQGFKVGSGSVIDEPAPPTKGGGNTLAPRDWAGNEQEKSQMSFDPDDNDFDVDFDQSAMTSTDPDKLFSWMTTLTPIGSISGDDPDHHNHKVKSFESLSLTETDSDYDKKLKQRRTSRMLNIPPTLLAGN
eukprot:sb/3468011/